MPKRRVRTATALVASALFVFPACAVKLSDKNSPLPNGGVTGPAADCTKVQPLGKGAPGTGAAAPKFVGRFDMTDPQKPAFDWSGNYIEARFEGTEVTVGLKVDKPTIFSAIVDDRSPIKFTAVPSREGYLIANDLAAGAAHEVVVHRESEALYGTSTFTGFNVGATGKLLPPIDRPRRIEIIGDSITCGYGDEGKNATCPFDVPVDNNNPNGDRLPVSENEYYAYGSVAARELDADVVTLCYSGKGVYQNYRDVGAGEGSNSGGDTAPSPDAKTTMCHRLPPDPDDTVPYYYRTLANQGDPAWDFTKEPQPQAVVINLGTNDFARDNNQDSNADGIDETKFKATYEAFVKDVRAKRPDAHIFLALPPMTTDKFPLDNARTDFRNILNGIVDDFTKAGDQKVYFIELVEMGTRYGLGCDYHPNLDVQQIMADQVAGAIRTKTCW